MDPHRQAVARACLEGAERNTMTFPEIVGTLGRAGFESYLVDYRCGTVAYYSADGDRIELPTHRDAVAVAARFDPGALQAAIAEAQALVPGYTYLGFSAKAKRAGCAGYFVSFSGRRALYFARTGETHTEHFPPAAA